MALNWPLMENNISRSDLDAVIRFSHIRSKCVPLNGNGPSGWA